MYLLKLNLARNSLRYIIRTYNIKEIHLPYYICPAIRQAVIKENCIPIFYHIDDNFMPMKTFDKNNFILYPNYFGVCDKNIDCLSQIYPYLIVDNAHSFFSKPKGFACFNSARKFLPVYNGSFLWIKDISFVPQKIQSPINYNIKSENDFDTLEIFSLSQKLESHINSFKQPQKTNFFKLHEKYENTNQLIIDTETISPFCYPYLANTNTEADDVANSFEQQGVTIYRYWNNLPENFGEYKFYRRLVPIPIYHYRLK